MNTAAMFSVIIPIHNASKYLPVLLEKLRSQTVKDFELIIIDSSSSDDSVNIAQSYGAKILTIAQSDFDHGNTRTLGARQACGDILVYLTQDALPCDEFTLENIIKAFTPDDNIAAVFGRQHAYPGASIFAQHLRQFNYPDTSYVRVLDDRTQYGIKTIFFSDAFSAYRKTALEDIGYFKNGLIFGEDTCAAAMMLLKGKKIAYAAQAKVFHSHNYTMIQDFRRYFDMGVFHRTEKWLLAEFRKPQHEAVNYIKSEISFLWKQGKPMLLAELFLRNAMKFSGYTLGFHHTCLPKTIAKKFSMNHSWWK